MQKFTNILEKNVEWAALGLAALWVLWVIWGYGVNRPVSIQLGSTQCSPGDADKYISDSIAKHVQDLLAHQGTLENVQKPNIIGDFEAKMKVPVRGDYGELAFYSPPPLRFGVGADSTGGPAFVIDGGGGKDKISAPPTIPPPQIVDVLAERDQVVPQQNILPAIASVPAAAAPAAAVPTYGGLGGPAPVGPGYGGMGDAGAPPAPLPPSNVPSPYGNAPAAPSPYGAPPRGRGTMPPGRPGAMGDAAAAGTQLVDKNWITIFAKFPEKTLDDNFRAVGIPALLNQKVYIEVQLVRQEQLVDGTWGPETPIPPLAMNTPPVKWSADPDRYLRWLSQPAAQMAVLTPYFYPGIKWRGGLPPMRGAGGDQDNAVQAPVQPAFDAMSIARQITGKGETAIRKFFATNKYTPDQQKAIREAKNRLDREEKAPPKAPTGGKRGGKGSARPGGGGADYDAQDPQDMRIMLAQIYPGYYDNNNGNPGNPAPGGFPAPPPTPAGPAAAPAIVKPGLNLDFDIWAYDETVVAGKTYRYKMRVLVKNPIYGVRNANAADDLTKVFALPADAVSSWSDWTQPIEAKAEMEMFLVGSVPGRESVRFNVYRWQNGQINKPSQPFTVTIGDTVGGMDRDSKINFDTGWTVVDIRSVGNNDCRVTLINDEGAQKVRYYRHDRDDPAQKELERQMASPVLPGSARDMRGG